MFYSVIILPLLVILLDSEVHAIDVMQVGTVPEKECFGTSYRFGYSGTRQDHYDSLRTRYEGCTVVRGNLELTIMDDPTVTYDLNFLRSIRIVTGYVLIGLTTVDVIPLVNLQMIRGDNLFRLMQRDYALAVVVTASVNQTTGLGQLLMPALREISRGQVVFTLNPLLCFVQTILWDVIIKQHASPVVYSGMPLEQNCEECDDACVVDGEKHCWGPGADNCQQVPSLTTCPNSCRNGCYQGSNQIRCCHSQCAGGCWGPQPKRLSAVQIF
ncbi:epidermal growth factor receptor-like [Liolophura sinensis]|uniref:epidermal growth factor receptor-like n=1 Tax=Liolophura sinensis TaxID=3198878 RepID=UPI003158C9ED